MSSVPRSAAITDGRVRSEKAQRSTGVARLSTLKSVPRVGSILWVDSAELRWIRDKIQRLKPGEYELLSSVQPGRKEHQLWMLFC